MTVDEIIARRGPERAAAKAAAEAQALLEEGDDEDMSADELDEEDDQLEQEMLRDLENGDLDFEGLDEDDDDEGEEEEEEEDEDASGGDDDDEEAEADGPAVKTRPVQAPSGGDEEDEEDWLGIREKDSDGEASDDDKEEAANDEDKETTMTGESAKRRDSSDGWFPDQMWALGTAAPGGFAALADVDGDMSDAASSEDDDNNDDDKAGPQTDADKANAAAVKAFFTSHKNASTSSSRKPLSFSTLPNCTLSRQLLLALGSLNLSVPTPIQAECIPLAMMGKDIVASSATGSGKTVAFWVGVLERLLHRDRRNPMTRVVVMTPTRELAVQVHGVGMALARYTDVTFCLCVGALPACLQLVLPVEDKLTASPFNLFLQAVCP